ncbi:MAG: hypothetical protein NZ843_02215, partial [Fimbriimonadales bacterium]|nr:hypothetical protein [Fimbriimonadales bacterium]
NQTARWRIIPPRSQRAFEPSPPYEEWVRLPEMEVRLGAEIEEESGEGQMLVVGVREYRMQAAEPFFWRVTLTDVVPEWLTPVRSTRRGADKAIAVVSLDLRPGQKGSPEGVSGAGECEPYAIYSHALRYVGYLQKGELHREVIDLTGLPVQVRDEMRLQPLGERTYQTPSGARVILAEPSRPFGAMPPKGWHSLILRIEIPETAYRASPLYARYGREPEITWSFTSEPRANYYAVNPLSPAGTPERELELAIPVRLVPTRQGWKLPSLKIEFTHAVCFGERFPFERTVPVVHRLRKLDAQAHRVSER